MSSINSPHPERARDEIFITYANAAGFEEIGWATKRKGTKVYDASGKEIPDNDIFPVFAKRSELAERGLTFAT